MSRARRPLAALALIAIVAPDQRVRFERTCRAPRSAAATPAANRCSKAVKFAKCMRSHGVSEFPDPGASGKLTIDGIANGSSLDPSTPAFKQAISACKDLEPAGFTGSKRSPQQQTAALKFAQCIRDNGVNDFPDPANGQPLVDTNRIPSSATSSGMSILNAAMQKCGDPRGSSEGSSGEAEDLGAGRSGCPGCRDRERSWARHVSLDIERVPRPDWRR